MEKAGYFQKSGASALDSDGIPHEVLEVHIQGARYAIRTGSLAAAITGKVFVQVEDLTRNWNYYLGNTCGLAQVSASGKALNIEIFQKGIFTISLGALRSVMYGRDRNAIIVKIPDHAAQFMKMRRVTQDQQQISATG